MRPVSGLDRPWLQWLFVALGVLLVVVAVLEAVGLRRLRSEIAALRASDSSGRLERQALEARRAREQSAREALSREVARLQGGTHAGVSQPTLTLSPLLKRGPTPPEPTVDAPPEGQPIQLRLRLPRGDTSSAGTYLVVVRTWFWRRGHLVAHRPARLDGRRASDVDGGPDPAKSSRPGGI